MEISNVEDFSVVPKSLNGRARGKIIARASPFVALIWGLLVLTLTCGCLHSPLRVRRELEGPWALPSVQLETPDPKKERHESEERLVIHWSLPPRVSPAQLKVKVRLSDATVALFCLSLAKSWGHWVLYPNQSRAKKQTVVAYRAEVWSQNRLYIDKTHPMWIEPPELQ